MIKPNSLLWYVLAAVSIGGCRPSSDTAPSVEVEAPSRQRLTSLGPTPRPTATPVVPSPTPILRPTEAPTPQPLPELPPGAKCSVHDVLLQRDSVRILYGSPQEPRKGYFRDRFKAAQQSFPYSNQSVEGGCAVSPEFPTHKPVIFCPQCRAAENEWVKAEDEQIKAAKGVKLPVWNAATPTSAM